MNGKKPRKQPLKITPKRLFFDMMDAANAAGMPCARMNVVADAIRALESAIKGLIECPDYKDISTLEMRAASKAHHTWIGGNDEKQS